MESSSHVLEDPMRVDSYKFLLAGDSGVGKTCFLLRYTGCLAQETHIATVGIDFKIRTVEVCGRKVKLQIWDTAGQERFRSIVHAYFKGAMGVLLLYDVTNETSFLSIRHWIHAIRTHAPEACRLLLVGNKIDLRPDNESEQTNNAVMFSRATELAQEYDAHAVECSAKTGIGVEDAVVKLVMAVREVVDNELVNKSHSDTINLMFRKGNDNGQVMENSTWGNSCQC